MSEKEEIEIILEKAKKNNQEIMLNSNRELININTGEIYKKYKPIHILEIPGVKLADPMEINNEGWIINTFTGEFFDNKNHKPILDPFDKMLIKSFRVRPKDLKGLLKLAK